MLLEGSSSTRGIGNIFFLSIEGMASSLGTNPSPMPCSTIGRIWSVVVTSIDGLRIMSSLRNSSVRYWNDVESWLCVTSGYEEIS